MQVPLDMGVDALIWRKLQKLREVDTDVNVIIVGKFYNVLQQHPAADSYMVSIWNWNKIQKNSTFFRKGKKSA